MSCDNNLIARRNADFRVTFSPASDDFTFADLQPELSIRRDTTQLLLVSGTVTPNGSNFIIAGDSAVATIKEADLLLLDGTGSDLNSDDLHYDLVMTDATGFRNWVMGGAFILAGLNDSDNCGSSCGSVEIALGGQCFLINIDGGNLGPASSVGLAELNQAVGEAKQAAEDASVNGAVAGAAAGATAGATAGSVSGADAGTDAANAVLSGKANTDASNISDSVWRGALGLGDSATRNVGASSGAVAAGDDSRIVGAAQKSQNLSDLSDTLVARNNLRVSEYSTRAVAIAQNIVPAVSYIRTNGYDTVGDDGGSLYERVASEPAHEAKFQTADGSWWSMAVTHVHPEMFGAKGDGVTDDSWPIDQAVGFASSIEFLAKTYVGTINAWRSVRIFGQGRHFTTLVCPVATGSAVNLAASPYYLRGMTVTRNIPATSGHGVETQTDGFGTLEDLISSEHWNGILFNSTANSTADSVYSRYNYNDGFIFLTSGTSEACQWKVSNSVSELNDGWGVSAYAIPISGPDQTGPVLLNVGTYKNGNGGWSWSGGAGTAWNDVNGVHCYSSFDNGPGMIFTNPGANNQFVDTFTEFSSMVSGGRNDNIPARLDASGIRIEGGTRNDSSLIFNGLVTMQNAISGIVNTAGSSLKVLQLLGVRAVDNGRAGGADRYGIYLSSTTTRTVITNAAAQGLLFTDQQFGIATGSTAIANKTSVIGAVMNGNSSGPTNAATTDFAAWVGVVL